LRFEETVQNFDLVIDKLNPLLSSPLPYTEPEDTVIAKSRPLNRAKRANLSEEQVIKMVSAPNSERDVQKLKIIASVQEYLSSHPRAQQLYDILTSETALQRV